MELTAEHLEKMQEFIRKVYAAPIRGDTYYTVSIEQDADQEALNEALNKASHRSVVPASAYQAVGKAEVRVGSWLSSVEPHPLCPEGYLIPKGCITIDETPMTEEEYKRVTARVLMSTGVLWSS